MRSVHCFVEQQVPQSVMNLAAAVNGSRMLPDATVAPTNATLPTMLHISGIGKISVQQC
jgi:hypothetical protein